MKNILLRTIRRQRGWSQKQLADFACVSLSTIERAERGETIRVDNIERICVCLQKSPEELGLIKTENQEINRYKANKTVVNLVDGLTNASSVIDTSFEERLSKALAKPASIDSQVLQGLEYITNSYWQLRSGLGYSSLIKGFLGHLGTVEQLLKHAYSPSVHVHLCSIVSEIAQCIGAIYFDMSNYSLAKPYYKVSIEAAREANNHILWVISLGRMSSLPIYNNKSHEAIPFLQEAQRVAIFHSSPQVKAWLASLEAEAQANLHNRAYCMQLLGHAERALENVKQEESPFDVKFDYARLAGYKGICYLYLQKPKEALEALNESVKSIDSIAVRQRSIITADIAAAYTQMEEIPAACSSASQALELNRSTKSSLVLQRLRKVRTSMRPWEATQIVKDFDAQMLLHTTLL
ncbi:XRE family transcriptional regulator [Ktedonosporobacter rubrisoli]|uniref:XRE family transcriptional regulator n=1 Tax=Ktedonosporobacter rubrisoli TaxID=2509675 RepID=A0A4P6JM09_KTERU|nr:helix-turn-helix transcriptional regulator [Ktedonosporobacter rubrisoli]QBD76032.1 XRE family transcriptional regulator [Ktedonosporobacter rubrisoli]